MHRPVSSGVSRRRLIAASALAPVVGVARFRNSLAAGSAAQISSAAARARLVAGNKRYASDQPLRVNHSARRVAVAPAQMPFAIVLGCSNFRVPPEILFDQGLGDIFTVRVAGNIADDLAIGSMEYAVEHFATPLIVVLGHEGCGAVSAAVAAVASGVLPPPHIASVVTALQPAVVASKDMPGDAVENAITTHVRQTVAALKASGPILADAVEHGRLEIIGAEYHLHSGAVGFLT